MPRRIYSKQFIFDQVGAGISRTYTVPVGYVAILTQMQAYASQASAAVKGSVQKPPGLLLTVWNVSGIAVNQVVTWTGRLVLVAGDVINIQESASPWAGQMGIYASGYLLTV